MNRTSIEIEAEILKRKLEESMATRRRLQERVEELEEKNRDQRQLIANQDAEITALRRKLTAVSGVLDDLLESEIRSREMLSNCMQVLKKIRAEVDGI